MLTAHLFGKFHIERNQQTLYEVPGGKTQELLCYLLLHRRQMHPRETLAALLWPDCETTKSKKYLRQVLWQLQLALNSAFKDRKIHALSIDADTIYLNGDGSLQVDVDMFEKAYQQGQGMAVEQMDTATAARLRQAVQLYRGDLLEGWYQEWCLLERERLQSWYLSILDKLIGYCQEQRDYQQGIDYGERILRLDRAHERSHQQLMSLYFQGGDRTAALRQYERCRTALQEELGVQPSRHTKALYEQMRADQPEVPSSQLLARFPEASPHTVRHLQHLLEFINEVELLVKNEIRVAKQAAQAPDRRLVSGQR